MKNENLSSIFEWLPPCTGAVKHTAALIVYLNFACALALAYTIKYDIDCSAEHVYPSFPLKGTELSIHILLLFCPRDRMLRFLWELCFALQPTHLKRREAASQRNDSKGEVEVCSRAGTHAHALFNMLT